MTYHAPLLLPSVSPSGHLSYSMLVPQRTTDNHRERPQYTGSPPPRWLTPLMFCATFCAPLRHWILWWLQTMAQCSADIKLSKAKLAWGILIMNTLSLMKCVGKLKTGAIYDIFYFKILFDFKSCKKNITCNNMFNFPVSLVVLAFLCLSASSKIWGLS